MANEILNSLLKEYEQKKRRAELALEKRKEQLYKEVPRLQEIEDELNHFAMSTSQAILQKGTSSLEALQEKVKSLKNEKEDILKSKNIDASFLKPSYECTICKDTGYVMDSNYKTHMCSCLKQKLLNISFNKSNMNNLDKENFETFNDLLFSNEVDVAKYRANISPRSNMQNIKANCMRFVENFDNPNTKNLLFTGNTGLR